MQPYTTTHYIGALTGITYTRQVKPLHFRVNDNPERIRKFLDSREEFKEYLRIEGFSEQEIKRIYP